jgi:hypothetical protein
MHCNAYRRDTYESLFLDCILLLRNWWETQETLAQCVFKGPVNHMCITSYLASTAREKVKYRFFNNSCSKVGENI